MDMLTTIYKVGETNVAYGAVSCSDVAVSRILTKAKSIAAFISATGDVGFVDIRFDAVKKDGSEFMGQVGAAPPPTSVPSAMAALLDQVASKGYVDCTGVEDVKVLRVRPVSKTRFSTNGVYVWFSGVVDNAVIETGRIPIDALDVTDAS